MTTTQLTEVEIAYLNELAADIASNGGLLEGVKLEDTLMAAHKRRQEFAGEMLACESKRSQMIREALMVTVWHAVQVIAAKERLDMQAKDCIRSALLACESIDDDAY